MKRSADEQFAQSESFVKRIRTSLNTSDESSLNRSTSSSLLAQSSLQTKDGIVEEIRVLNFMSFASHKFRLDLSVHILM